MNTVKHRLRLDLALYEQGLFAEGDNIVYVRRGDDLSHELIVSLRNHREPYVISDDTRAYLYAYTEEGDRLLEECTVKGNEVKVLLKATMLQRSIMTLALRLVGEGGEILTFPPIKVVSLADEGYTDVGDEITSLDEYAVLLQAIRKAEDSVITSVKIEKGDLIITYGDGNRQNAGRAVGEKGDKGEDGKDGTIWHYGNLLTGEGESIMCIVPGAVTGDFYLNTDTGNVYVSAGGDISWKYVESLKGDKGDKGERGKSAYEVDVELGFKGDEEEWLASLKGDKGDKGDTVTISSINIQEV